MICGVTLEHVWVYEDLSVTTLPVDYQYIVINNNNNAVNARSVTRKYKIYFSR